MATRSTRALATSCGKDQIQAAECRATANRRKIPLGSPVAVAVAAAGAAAGFAGGLLVVALAVVVAAAAVAVAAGALGPGLAGRVVMGEAGPAPDRAPDKSLLTTEWCRCSRRG